MVQRGVDVSRVEVNEDSNVPGSGCTRTNCGPPLRGGLAIGPGYWTYDCTGGFTAQNSGGDQYLLTAGHCYDSGALVYHANHRVGGVPASIHPTAWNDENIDAARIWVGGSDLDYWKDNSGNLSRWIYVNSSAISFQIRDVYSTWDIYEGLFLCRTGKTTGKRCGPTGNTHYDVYNAETGGTHLDHFEVVACGRDGDSGGPVWNEDPGYGRAAGLAVVFTFDNYSPASCSPDWTQNTLDRMYAPYITNVQSRLGVQVITN